MPAAIVVVGFSVSLSLHFLLEGALRAHPAFDRRTVDRLGAAPAAFFFAVCGPVMVVRAGLGRDGRGRRPRWPLSALAFALLWAGLVGIVAVETGRLVAAA